MKKEQYFLEKRHDFVNIFKSKKKLSVLFLFVCFLDHAHVARSRCNDDDDTK